MDICFAANNVYSFTLQMGPDVLKQNPLMLFRCGIDCVTWSYEPCHSFDHIRRMVFTCTRRNLGIHIPVHIVNISIWVFDQCVLFAQRV